MMISLDIQHVTKKYGKTTAVNDFSFAMDPGVYGLIGPNGAGKSTLIKMITTNLSQYEGTIYFGEQEIRKMGASYRDLLGYMPQTATGYGDFTAKQFLYYMSALKGIKKNDAKKKISELSGTLSLEQHLNRKVKTYSGGMKQRMFFLQALLNDPRVLVLDEPTAGLDPLKRIRLRNYISSIAKDKIILIATHVMQDIETIAKEVDFIKEGSLLFKGSIPELIGSLKGKVKETWILEEEWIDFQQAEKITRSLRMGNKFHVRYLSDGDAETNVLPSLEDAYLYYMG